MYFVCAFITYTHTHISGFVYEKSYVIILVFFFARVTTIYRKNCKRSYFFSFFLSLKYITLHYHHIYIFVKFINKQIFFFFFWYMLSHDSFFCYQHHHQQYIVLYISAIIIFGCIIIIIFFCVFVFDHHYDYSIKIGSLIAMYLCIHFLVSFRKLIFFFFLYLKKDKKKYISTFHMDAIIECECVCVCDNIRLLFHAKEMK